MKRSQLLRRRLGALLVEKGVITHEELEQALAAQEEQGGLLGEILVQRGFASRLVIIDALAEQGGVLFEPERGFGTGLRSELVRRHDWRRGRLRKREPNEAPQPESDQPAATASPPEAAAPPADPPEEQLDLEPGEELSEESGDPALGESPRVHAERERPRRRFGLRLRRSRQTLDERSGDVERRRDLLADEEAALGEEEERLAERRRRLDELALPPEEDGLADALLKRVEEWEELTARLRLEVTSFEEQLRISREAISERDRRIAELVEEEARLRHEVERLEGELGSASEERERLLELERLLKEERSVRASVEAERGLLDETLAESDRLRDEAGRLERELGSASEERERQVTELERLLDEERSARASVEADRGRLDETLAERDQLRLELTDRQARLDELRGRLDAEKADWMEARARLEHELSSASEEGGQALAERDRRLAELERLLDEERSARASVESDRGRLDEALAERDRLRDEVGRLERELGSSSEERDRLAGELERLLDEERAPHAGAAAQGAEPVETPPAAESEEARGHLLFVHGAGGYSLVGADGAAPPIGADVTVPGLEERFVVVKVGRSPLPFDLRACAFVEVPPGRAAGRNSLADADQ